ncbi:hypothetical protein BKA82DRAFT_2874462 [Pisolithus tinctorius]|nr:hypothetical protein BKA82DRAFT_2874462 [Pisolithus tinctorius]
MCPRRLNTAGGLAVHIASAQLEPENLPRIENALPGRDGYEVEIFGMEGIPAPDVADYKRRREIELGLAAGSISQPQPKRPKIDNRPLSEDELRAQLEARKALMGASSDAPAAAPAPEATAAVYNAATAYAVPPAPTPGITPLGASPPPGLPGISSPPFMPGVLPPGPFPASLQWLLHSLACQDSLLASTPWLSYAASGSAAATWNASPRCTTIPSWCFPSASSAAHLRACELIFASRAYEWDACFSSTYRVVPPAATAPQPPAVSSHRHLYFLILLSSKSMDLSRRRPT